MSFLAPWMLLGSLAAGVPLVLHFFYRARFRRQPWAAMTFLRQAIEQTSRRVRFQELVLLVLRCAVMLLLALALARPAVRGLTAGGRGESIDAVFVFDTSASMSARDGEKTRLERAKEAALAVLDNLPANSTVQVFGCADRVTPLGPLSPGNLDQARQIVQALETTSLSTDVLPGLTEAHAALDRGAGTNKEVYLFTDVQKSGWDRQSAAVRAKCDEIKQRATLLVVRCGNPERAVRNVSVADVTFPGGIPHTGTRMPFTVLVRNTGDAAVQNVPVALEVDGKPLEKEGQVIPEIGKGESVPVTLTARLDQAGPRVVTATVGNDDLPADNRLDKVIPVRERVRVLIVDGTPDLRDPKEAGSHFVQNALIPVADNLRDEYFVRVTVVPAQEAAPPLLGVADVCVLLNVPASNADRPGVPGLWRDFVDRLAEFVKAGGGLVIAGGYNVVPARYNAVLGTGGVDLLPFDLDEPATATAEKPFKPAPDTAESPSFLGRFRDEPYRTVTADVDVLSLLGVKGESAASRILLRMADHKPLVCSKAVGEGEVILVTTSLDARWTNWPARAGSYLAFLQWTLAHLTGKSARGANRVAGEPIVWVPTDAAKGYEVRGPNDRRTKVTPAAAANGPLAVTVADTAAAGVYQITPEATDPPTGPTFAVAPDLRETDELTALTDAEVEQTLGFRPVLLQATATDSFGSERTKREWTVWALLILFGLAVTESVWAWFCGKAW